MARTHPDAEILEATERTRRLRQSQLARTGLVGDLVVGQFDGGEHLGVDGSEVDGGEVDGGEVDGGELGRRELRRLRDRDRRLYGGRGQALCGPGQFECSSGDHQRRRVTDPGDGGIETSEFVGEASSRRGGRDHRQAHLGTHDREWPGERLDGLAQVGDGVADVDRGVVPRPCGVQDPREPVAEVVDQCRLRGLFAEQHGEIAGLDGAVPLTAPRSVRLDAIAPRAVAVDGAGGDVSHGGDVVEEALRMR